MLLFPIDPLSEFTDSIIRALARDKEGLRRVIESLESIVAERGQPGLAIGQAVALQARHRARSRATYAFDPDRCAFVRIGESFRRIAPVERVEAFLVGLLAFVARTAPDSCSVSSRCDAVFAIRTGARMSVEFHEWECRSDSNQQPPRTLDRGGHFWDFPTNPIEALAIAGVLADVAVDLDDKGSRTLFLRERRRLSCSGVSGMRVAEARPRLYGTRVSAARIAQVVADVGLNPSEILVDDPTLTAKAAERIVDRLRRSLSRGSQTVQLDSATPVGLSQWDSQEAR